MLRIQRMQEQLLNDNAGLADTLHQRTIQLTHSLLF
jgi:hypothetical protein